MKSIESVDDLKKWREGITIGKPLEASDVEVIDSVIAAIESETTIEDDGNGNIPRIIDGLKTLRIASCNCKAVTADHAAHKEACPFRLLTEAFVCLGGVD